MPFGIPKDLSVLEAKFQIYEDLSKEMLDKLERAVDKISESNQNVALILERHENRLDQVDKAEAAILELIKAINNKLEQLERKVEDLSKFRWVTMGVLGAATLVIGSAAFFGNLLTVGSGRVTIGGAPIQSTK
jgi:ABC-type Fe3+-hydroxamate transport system substrate-binding protein